GDQEALGAGKEVSRSLRRKRSRLRRSELVPVVDALVRWGGQEARKIPATAVPIPTASTATMARTVRPVRRLESASARAFVNHSGSFVFGDAVGRRLPQESHQPLAISGSVGVALQ